MKAAVFLLVLANLLFFAFGQGYFGQPDNPDAGRLAKQVRVNELRVVGSGEPPAAKTETPAAGKTETEPAEPTAPAVAPPAAPAAPAPAIPDAAGEKAAKPLETACAVWSKLDGDDSEKLGKLLSGFADLQGERKTAAEGGSWWVYIPPLSGKAEADRKAGELKRLGVSDYFVIQETGPNRWAISLGLFSVENGAKTRLAELKEKGVRSARIGTRGGRETARYEVRGAAERLQALRAAAAKSLPKLAVQDCK